MPNQKIREDDVLDFISSRLNTPKSTVPQKYIIEFFPYENFNLTRDDSNLIKEIISDLASKKRILITYRSVGEGEDIERVPIIEPYNEEKAKKIIPVEPIEKRIHLRKYIRRRRIREFGDFLLNFILASSIILLVWTLIYFGIPHINWEEVTAAFLTVTIVIYFGLSWYFCMKKR